jgi:hypothetical protein
MADHDQRADTWVPRRSCSISKGDGMTTSQLRERPKRHFIARLASWSGSLAVAFVLAGVVTRWLFTSGPGIRLIDSVPEAFWQAYYGLLGMRGEWNVERLQDADVTLVFVVCLLVMASLVWAARVLLKRARQSSRKSRPA